MMDSSGSTYWCHRCDRFIRVHTQHIAICPDCGSGFVEGIDDSILSPISPISQPNLGSTNARFRRSLRRTGVDRTLQFNPIIALPSNNLSYSLYYDDGSGVGLQPLPGSILDFLMGSGFDRILHQLGQLDLGQIGSGWENPPAAKFAVKNMPVVKIVDSHITSELHCAVCKEPFVIDNEAREMPCKHIYHSECILPWLLSHNSCPVCRYKLPSEMNVNGGDSEGTMVGLRIWRLPGGGFAVGRFMGGRETGEVDFPVVYTEMDGGFDTNNGGTRNVSWPVRGRIVNRSRGIRRAINGFLSLFRRVRSSNVEVETVSRATHSHSPSSLFTRRRRHGEEWTFGV